VRQFQFKKGNDTRSTLLFHCDFHEGWWMQFASAAHLDVLCMSCPCPAWTYPNFHDNNTGLLREDGLLTIEAIRRADILDAQIILFENVMTMTSHPHFPLVKAALEYYGYVMVWDKCLNLSDVCPQHRARFLAMIVKKDLAPRVQNFQLSSWPSMPKPTLGSFGAICEVSLELEQLRRHVTGGLWVKGPGYHVVGAGGEFHIDHWHASSVDLQSSRSDCFMDVA